ncbi:MAG: DUF4105 domain-containing protein [Thermodesulfobacteriota bacterium]
MKPPGGRRAIFRLASAVFFALLLLAAPAFCRQSPSFAKEQTALNRALERAAGLGLSSDPYWRTLCHYRKTARGISSRIDDPAFFCSPQGKTDPQAELEALIRLLFTPAQEPGQGAFCRFPARSAWVVSRLAIPESDFPQSGCPEVEETLRRIAPAKSFIVFAASNMQNPASLFGHTLIVVDSEAGTRLTANAVNFSAITPPEFGPLYIVKGIFGLYPGRFGVGPYYAKLSDYSDMGRRDMWEYPLNLEPAETRRMLLALLEMAPFYSDYYFADENCSFALLYLLDAARPGLSLADRAGVFVFPADTLRVAESAGLFSGPPRYVPSRTARIAALADRLDRPEIRAAQAVSRGSLSPSSMLEAGAGSDEQALQLDLAAQLISLAHTEKEVDQKTFAGRFRDILAVRAGLPASPEEPAPAEPAQPLAGHLPTLLAAGAGAKDGEPFLAAHLRLLYQGLDDPDLGFRPGAQIFFGDAEVRFYPGRGATELERLTLLDITSLAPRSLLFSPASFRIHLGLSRMPVRKGGDTLAGDLSYGRGVCYESPLLGLSYALVCADLGLSGALDQSYDLGPALRAGAVRDLGGLGKLHLGVTATHYALGERHDRVKIFARGSFFTRQNAALFWEASEEKAFGRTETEVSLCAGGYF